MTEHSMMPDLVELAIRKLETGRTTEVEGLAAGALDIEALIAAFDERGELVDREVVLDPVAELLGDVPGVVAERFRRLLRAPPAVLVLERLRQVPVVERRVRLDAGRQQLVDEAAVEVDALRVRRAGAVREDARPGDREAIGVRADIAHERHVVRIAMVGVVRDVAVVAVLDQARRVGVPVPDRFAFAVLVPRPLDLVRGGGHTPGEPVRKPAAHAMRRLDGCDAHPGTPTPQSTGKSVVGRDGTSSGGQPGSTTPLILWSPG